MGHKIHIQSREQYIAAIEVLNYTQGTWLGIGPSSAPVIVVTDDQFKALVDAGVVSANGEDQVAAQEVVLIEQVPVHLIEAAELF